MPTPHPGPLNPAASSLHPICRHLPCAARTHSCHTHRARLSAKPQFWRTSDDLGSHLPRLAKMGSCLSHRARTLVKPPYWRTSDSTSKLCKQKQPPATGTKHWRCSLWSRILAMAVKHHSKPYSVRRQMVTTLWLQQCSRKTVSQCSVRSKSAQAACAASRHATIPIALPKEKSDVLVGMSKCTAGCGYVSIVIEPYHSILQCMTLTVQDAFSAQPSRGKQLQLSYCMGNLGVSPE